VKMRQIIKTRSGSLGSFLSKGKKLSRQNFTVKWSVDRKASIAKHEIIPTILK
jgi:hypothetical protein